MAKYLQLSKLKLHPNNPRTIKDESFKSLCKSIKDNKEYFEARPIICSNRTGENIIIAGNQRYRAAMEIGLKAVPTVILQKLTKAREKEIIIRDNISNGDWNFDILANDFELEDLKDWGVELPDFDINNEGETEDDAIPEPPKIPKSKLGDIFLLGNHRLMCGDSVNADDVALLMDGKKADMVFTDPPYGIDYSGGRTKSVRKKTYGRIKGDKLVGDNLGGLLTNVFKFGAKEIYICVSSIKIKPFLDELEKQKIEIDAFIVWDKQNIGLGYMAYRRQCEFIIYVRTIPFKKSMKSDSDLWSIGKDSAKDYVHGTQKPVELITRAINNSSKNKDNVLNLFGGSGSTLIACEKINRKCFMMELDPIYIDVIIQRWEEFTGKKAVKL